MQPTAGDSDSNSSSSGVSSSSSDSDSGAVGVSGAASGPDPAEGGLLADVLLLNKLSGVIHAAVPCGEETPARRCVRLGGRLWKAACGSLLTQAPESYLVGPIAPWDAEPCCRGPCARSLPGIPRDIPASPP